MARQWRGSRIGELALLVALAACGRDDSTLPKQATRPVRIAFEDRPEPAVFNLEGLATRDGPEGSPGLWVTVVGLERPERGLVENTATGKQIVVALFTARKGANPAIRLSNDAADALGIGDVAATVDITALRREPRFDTTQGRF